MKNSGKKRCAALLAGALGLMTLTASLAEPVQEAGTEQAAQQDGAQALETYDFPTMGMTANFSSVLFDQVDRNELAVLMDEVPMDDGSALRYGMMSWNTVTDLSEDTEDMSWNLDCFGALGVYQSDLVNQLDELTGCDTHEKLGESADGAYQYYLSVQSTADADLVAELRRTQISIMEMEPYQPYEKADAGTVLTGSLGAFTTQDIHGETYTQEMFQDYDLTLVNLFTTWCSPCVAEIPELEKLRQAMADRGVNVVGFVLDVLDENGEIQQDSLEKAKLLAERTGAGYPFLLPDATYLNGRLASIDAFPETFFVDRDGNIVGDTYSGGNDLEGWTKVVEQELAKLKEGA